MLSLEYYSAFYFYFKNKFLRAQKYAEKALVESGVPNGEIYKGSLDKLIAELSKETKGTVQRPEET
jgi:hypothetical protein